MTDKIVGFARQHILQYLDANPAAADTLEGIHRWWIQWPSIDESSAITQQALEQLEAQGLIRRNQLGTHTMWRKGSA